MQLIMNSESSEIHIEKMSTLDQESLIKKTIINGTNDVKDGNENQESPIANKENIQVQENNTLITAENGNSELNKQDKDKEIDLHVEDTTKETVEKDTEGNECKQSLELQNPIVENGVGIDHQSNTLESQNDIVDNGEENKNGAFEAENPEENKTIDEETKDDMIVKELSPAKENTPVEDVKEHTVAESEKTDIDLKDSEEQITNFEKPTEQTEDTIVGESSDKEIIPVPETNDTNSDAIQSTLNSCVDTTPLCQENENKPLNQEKIQESMECKVADEEDIQPCDSNTDDKEPTEILKDVEMDDVEDNSKELFSKTGESSVEAMEPKVNSEDSNNSTKDSKDVVSESIKNVDDPEINTKKDNSDSGTEDVEMISVENKTETDVTNPVIPESHDINTDDKVPEQNLNDVEMNDVEDNNKELSSKIEDSSLDAKENETVTINKDKNEVKEISSGTIDVTDDSDEVKIIENDSVKDSSDTSKSSSPLPQNPIEIKSPTVRLSNTLDILSDDDDEEPVKPTTPEPSKAEDQKAQESESNEKSDKCISLDDDDDIMLIDDAPASEIKEDTVKVTEDSTEKQDQDKPAKSIEDVTEKKEETATDTAATETPKSPDNIEKVEEKPEQIPDKPLIPENFFKSYKKNLSEMTRDDLEELCILKIVESIIERSNLNDIKAKLKTMALGLEEYKKKALTLAKQNRDLQVVLKSIQEEQKKKSDTAITPLKITRSVGMQVIMPDKNRRKTMIQNQNSATNSSANVPTNTTNATGRPQRNSNQNQRNQNTSNNPQGIPVPRLVPANNTVANRPAPNTTTNKSKPATPVPNVAKNISPAQKTAEKRTLNRSQSVTVDLTDDEPPAKQMTKCSPVPPVRLVPSQNLLPPARQQFPSTSPRKVFIPISGPQAQNIKPGQAMMLKSVPQPNTRPPRPPMVRVPQSQVRAGRSSNSHWHPAPLPDVMKQYQPPNWKALPPAPSLKLSKVENGIVISWKIDGYQEDSYEQIASYQLYAYQETSSPPSTALWKKIGDVKALPLPMACTLTQFMAGYKYYFAVRAVDIRSRLGPFSVPGNILLLNKT